MIKQKACQEERTFYVVESITCDLCQIEYTAKKKMSEIVNFHRISFITGFGSIFGDNMLIICDICQHCLNIVLDGKYREVDLSL